MNSVKYWNFYSMC